MNDSNVRLDTLPVECRELTSHDSILQQLCNAFSLLKRGVALTGRNTTGPPSCAASWWVTLHMRVLQTTTDDDSRQRASLVTLFCTMCWRISNRMDAVGDIRHYPGAATWRTRRNTRVIFDSGPFAPTDETKPRPQVTLLARLHILYGFQYCFALSGICRCLSSSVTLHGGPAGGFTRAGQAMTSCRLQSNYSSMVTLHGGPAVLLRPVKATLCWTFDE